MTPLEQPFQTELEFHRRLREASEPLTDAGSATGQEVEVLKERLAWAGDTRDVLAARDAVKRLLGLSPLET